VKGEPILKKGFRSFYRPSAGSVLVRISRTGSSIAPDPGLTLPKDFSQARLQILHSSEAPERNFCSVSIRLMHRATFCAGLVMLGSN
jgi:hypothetical protein